jgi:membrane protease YdiL (CAAX protease family)
MTAKERWYFFLNALNPAFIWRQASVALRFSLRPCPDEFPAEGRYRALVSLLALLVALKCVQILVIVIRVFSEDYGIMSPLENTLNRETDGWPWWQLMLAAGMMGPILEEIAFRAHLRFSRMMFSLSAAIAVYYMLTQAIYGVRTHDLETGFAVRLAGAATVGIGCYLLFRSFPKLEAGVRNFWRRQFKWVFWGVAIAFGAAHLSRYDIGPEHLIFIPLIILPQVFSALFYGFARMKYGLAHSMGMHVFANMFAAAVSVLAK